MREPIKVGDLVMVVKPTPCCRGGNALGFLFRVDYIASGPQRCVSCGWRGESTDAWFDGSDTSWPLSVLKRIPPLDELEGVDEREELTA